MVVISLVNDEDKKFRMISYDLDIHKLEKYYKFSASAYKALIRNLAKCGYNRRQFSGYISDVPKSYEEVFSDLRLVCRKLPWLYECSNKLDVTDIGNTLSLMPYAEIYCAKKTRKCNRTLDDSLMDNLFSDEFNAKAEELKSKIDCLVTGNLKGVLPVVDRPVDFVGENENGVLKFRLNIVWEKEDGSLLFLKGNEASTISFFQDELQQKMANYQAAGESSEVESFLKAAYVHNIKLRQKVIENVVQEEQRYYERLASHWGLDIGKDKSVEKDWPVEIDYSEFFEKHLNRCERGSRER